MSIGIWQIAIVVILVVLIFGTGKFYKEKQDNKKENIYSNIDEMLSGTLKNDDE